MLGNGAKMTSEQEMQKMAMEMNYYRQKAEELQTQMRSLAAFVQESDSAKKALESLGEEESFFAVGAGVFVRAKPSSQKVLVETGARVIAEKTAEEAKAFLDARKEELVKAMSKIQEDLEGLNAAMVALSEKARQE